MEQATTIIDGGYPPNIEDIKKVFKLNDNVIFTYGNTIYNPNRGNIDLALMAHEQTHSIQQGDKVKEWWERYLKDKEFRLSQELQAYQVQYQYYCKAIKDRNQRYRFLNRLAGDLSSEIYGNIISRSEAIKQIANK
jgi:hypothetical protein